MEVVIAIAVLSVGLAGAMRVFPVGLRASQRAELSSRSALAAQRTLESIKLTPWEALTEGQTTTESDGLQVTTQVRTVVLPPLVDPTRVKAVEVTVQSLRPRPPRPLTFLTYLRRPEE